MFRVIVVLYLLLPFSLQANEKVQTQVLSGECPLLQLEILRCDLEEHLEVNELLLNTTQRALIGNPSKKGLAKLIDIAEEEIDNNLPLEVVTNSYRKAHEYAPESIEPLFHLSRYYNKMGRIEDAYYAALMGMQIYKKQPSADQSLFSWIYEYGMLWEYGLLAYKMAKFELAIEVTEHLLKKGSFPLDSLKTLQQNLNLYKFALPYAHYTRENWGLPPWERADESQSDISFSHFRIMNQTRPKLHICTLATDRTPMLDQLVESCAYQNLTIEILGMGEPFFFGNKIKKIREYLETLPEENIFLFVDAYDVLILADEEKIVKKFLAMDTSILFSAEAGCGPISGLSYFYPQSPTKYKYLNSGSYIGYVKEIKRIIDQLGSFPTEFRDQGLFTYYFLYHPGEIRLDYYCEFFFSLNTLDDDEIFLDRMNLQVYNTYTGTVPCLIHGPGSVGQKQYQNIYNCFFDPQVANFSP